MLFDHLKSNLTKIFSTLYLNIFFTIDISIFFMFFNKFKKNKIIYLYKLTLI